MGLCVGTPCSLSLVVGSQSSFLLARCSGSDAACGGVWVVGKVVVADVGAVEGIVLVACGWVFLEVRKVTF